MMNIIYPLLLAFVLTSCTDNSQTTPRHVEMPVPLEIKQITATDSLKIPDMRNVIQWKLLSDSRIAIYDYGQTNALVGVYKLPKLDHIYTYGKQGRGPNELVSAMWADVNDPNQISLYDVMSKKQYIMEATDTNINVLAQYPLALMHDVPLAKPYQTIQQTSAGNFLYYAQMRPPNGTLLEVRNPRKNTLSDSLNTVLDTEMHDAYILTRPIRNEVFVAFSGLNRIELFDINDSGKMIPYLTIGDILIENQNIEHCSYIDIQTDGEFIYALNNNFAADIESAKTTLEKWNMKGELLIVYTLDRYIDKILPNPVAGNIYGHSPLGEKKSIFIYELD